jgi:hypothetical protein
VIELSFLQFVYNSFDGDPNDLDLGDEVEYTLCRKSAKHSAENIHKLPKGTIPPEVCRLEIIYKL